ncbi:Uncharacterized protein Adt_46004 [Abeliophyllum distichum]|uniref:Uncharacterized protein n=1 Tax=Abeliophyllum distichum TaxID=126358 RepID=A0ABD1P308_9LAMI
MAHHQQSYAAPNRVPRPSIASNTEYIDPNNSQVDPNTKTRQVRWNDEMDGFMITRTSESSVGRENLSSENGGRNCVVRYEEMELIFGNDTATGDRAVSGFDNFSPIQGHSKIINTGSVLFIIINLADSYVVSFLFQLMKVLTSLTRQLRKQIQAPNYIAHPKKIAQAMEMQAALDTLNHVNWQLITEKLEAMELDLVDILKVMKAFRADGDLAKIFVSLSNTTIMRALVYEQLGRDPPPLP